MTTEAEAESAGEAVAIARAVVEGLLTEAEAAQWVARIGEQSEEWRAQIAALRERLAISKVLPLRSH